MRCWLTLFLLFLPLLAQAEACIVHSTGKQVEVKLCQHNVSIPPQMFHDSFCQPQLPEQTVEVTFVEQCPAGAFGACRNARVTNFTYTEDIHYYGVASDGRVLKLACEQQYQGVWEAF
jgi:hypothetical protein